jgi:hypothetical protein
MKNMKKKNGSKTRDLCVIQRIMNKNESQFGAYSCVLYKHIEKF